MVVRSVLRPRAGSRLDERIAMRHGLPEREFHVVMSITMGKQEVGKLVSDIGGWGLAHKFGA